MNETLPPKAYAILRSSVGEGGVGRIIEIVAGESGYYPMSFDDGRPVLGGPELRDGMNADLGVTPVERVAMENGSMFGWNVPGADPRNPMVIKMAGKEGV